MKKALITGLTGQDGSYLAELLLAKGYEVHGIVRRVANEDINQRFSRLNHIMDKITIHNGDVTVYNTLLNIIELVKPDECYHLAAQSFVSYSFDDQFGTFRNNIDGTINILSALRVKAPFCRFYFAGSSEMFGKVLETPQVETTPFYPRSPYGVTKTTGYHLTRNYRESYDMFACSGILFNHESPRRGFEFVTRKITNKVAEIKLGLADSISLGNLDAKRDWGFSGDYVEAMWLMLQQEKANDYVIATGKTHSIRDFLDIAFGYVDLDWNDFVVVDKNFFRPAEVNILLGDPTKAKIELGWEPKTSFIDLVHMMVDNDLELLA